MMRVLPLAAAIAILAADASAQTPPPCIKTGELILFLTGKHSETPLLWDAPGGSTVNQLWGRVTGPVVGGKPRGWTIVAHHSNGMSCIVAAGKDLPEWAMDLAGEKL